MEYLFSLVLDVFAAIVSLAPIGGEGTLNRYGPEALSCSWTISLQEICRDGDAWGGTEVALGEAVTWERTPASQKARGLVLRARAESVVGFAAGQ
jgi:hypothetical protein